MNLIRCSIALATALLLCHAAIAADPQASPAYVVERGVDLPPEARQAIDRMVAKGAPAFSVIVARDGREISRVHVGHIDSTTRFPIASASKWLAAAVVMQLVGEGRLSLDEPVSTWLPDIQGDAGSITLRQLLAQTSGLAGSMKELFDLGQDHRITLAQSAQEITGRPLAHRPGDTFVYGGPGFQVAGAVVEAVTGQRWEAVFQQRLARPLGMKSTYWTHLKLGAPAPPAAETSNPVLQGGAVSTADDYMRFLTLLAQNGRYQGRRVLTRKAVAAMHTDQTRTATMTRTGAPVMENAHYGLGNWCETWDRKSRCTRNSSIGAFGTYPWIDRPSGLYGIVFINLGDDAVRVWPETQAVQAALIDAHR
jgi:CubicO group peptidase (beta-lactamase class C family)